MSISPAEAMTLGTFLLGITAVITLPVIVLAAGLYTVAWWRGWSPTRARYLLAVAWLLPLVAWLVGGSPAVLWHTAAWCVDQQAYALAWLPLLPWLTPFGLTMGAVAWAARWNAARNGTFRSPRQAGIWIHRQHQHAMRRARSEARRPGLVPMTTRRGDPVLGRAAMLSEGGAGQLVPADPRLLRIPLAEISRNLVIIGETGAGKTVAILRLMRAWLEGAWLRHVHDGADRPLLIFLDCKGGSDGEATARNFREMCRALGIASGRIGLWPSEVRLDLWSLPPERLVEVLVEMARTDNVYYADIQHELVALAVLAPCGPPVSSLDFVRRLNPQWLLGQYGADRPGERESIEQNRQAFAGIAARYRVLFQRLASAFDSGRGLDDFDALVCTLEGTENMVKASAQAQAIVELITDLATTGGASGVRRSVLVVIDEFSAVSERVQVSRLMERLRSLGVTIIPAGQSWTSLGPTEDERVRLVTSAAGGALILGTSDPEPISKWAGTQVSVEVGIKRIEDAGPSGPWGDEGTGRAQRSYLVDPDWIRQLGRHKGQAVYINHGQALWGVITPVEVTEKAPAILPVGHVRRQVAAYRAAVVTRGDRIPRDELLAGLASEANPNAAFNADDLLGGPASTQAKGGS